MLQNKNYWNLIERKKKDHLTMNNLRIDLRVKSERKKRSINLYHQERRQRNESRSIQLDLLLETEIRLSWIPLIKYRNIILNWIHLMKNLKKMPNQVWMVNKVDSNDDILHNMSLRVLLFKRRFMLKILNFNEILQYFRRWDINLYDNLKRTIKIHFDTKFR